MGVSGSPNTVLFGYLEGVSRHDADAYARGFARRTLATAERVWYRTDSFWTGYLYEVHDGGPGQSFLPELITALAAEPTGMVLVPSGRRVFQLTISNGRPTGALLSEEKSVKVHRQLAMVAPAEKTGGNPYGVMVPTSAQVGHIRFHTVRPTQRMKRLASADRPLMLMATAALASGLILLSLGAGSYLWALNQRSIRGNGVDFTQLPHRQWPMVMSALTASTYVTKLEYKDGRWSVDTAVEPKVEGVIKDSSITKVITPK